MYQLCLLAGAPLGAWVCGLTIEGIGLSSAFVLIAGATLLVSVLTAVFSPLWHLKAVRSA